MKKTLFIILTAAVCGCQSNQGNNNASQTEQPTESKTVETTPKAQNEPAIDMTVDWEKPLYTLDSETGDTLQKWVYDGNTVIEYSMGNYGEGSTTYKYDDKHRLVSDDGNINTGNTHHSSMEYIYQDKKRYGTGQQSTEGSPSYTEIDEIVWYADDACTMDTLVQILTAEMEWDADVEKDKEVESSTIKKYKDGKLIEQITYGCDYINVKDLAPHFRSRTIYKYNSAGLLAEETMLDKDGNPLGEYATTTYTYTGNKCESTDTGTGSITYYAKK